MGVLLSCFFYLVKTRGLEAAPGFLQSFPCHYSHKCVHQEWGGGGSYRIQAPRRLNVHPYTKKLPSPNYSSAHTLPNLQSTCLAITQNTNLDKNSLWWLVLLASRCHCRAILCLLEGIGWRKLLLHSQDTLVTIRLQEPGECVAGKDCCSPRPPTWLHHCPWHGTTCCFFKKAWLRLQGKAIIAKALYKSSIFVLL